MRPPWAHHHGRHRPPLGWMLARGIHRRVLWFLLLAAALGVAGGAALHAAIVGGAGHGVLCVAIALIAAIWPLAWVATFRIAWPLRELAQVASEIRVGRLERRDALPGGPSEVGEVSEALRGVTERLAKQLRDQRALMAAVSHELRSPLGRARVLVELARDGAASGSLHDDLQAEIDAMDGLVGDLLAAARIDFEAVSPVPVDAAHLARRAAEIAAPVAAGVPPAEVEVVEVLEDDAGTVLADPTLLARALAVLLDNARRYGARTIRVHVRGRVNRVRFEVEDDGPGFAPGDEERAFEPFWRGSSAAKGGEGLGLALVRQIAEAHQGEAGAVNRPEGGARVWIELPRS